MKLRNYETVFIMSSVLSEIQVKDVIGKYRKYLEDLGAEIIFEAKPKFRKLAYPINKKSTGIYEVLEFKAPPEVIGSLEEEYRIDDDIIRFLTVSLDKHGVEYNKKKREMDALEMVDRKKYKSDEVDKKAPEKLLEKEALKNKTEKEEPKEEMEEAKEIEGEETKNEEVEKDKRKGKKKEEKETKENKKTEEKEGSTKKASKEISKKKSRESV